MAFCDMVWLVLVGVGVYVPSGVISFFSVWIVIDWWSSSVVVRFVQRQRQCRVSPIHQSSRVESDQPSSHVAKTRFDANTATTKREGEKGKTTEGNKNEHGEYSGVIGVA